ALLYPSATAEPLGKDALEAVAKDYLLAEAVIDRASRLADSVVLHALLQQPVELDLSNEAAAQRTAKTIAAMLKTTDKIAIDPVYDEKTEQFIIQIKKIQHGVEHRTRIDTD